LNEPLKELPLPPEPAELRAETRALVEDSPGEGIRLINEARFLADLLWMEWAEKLEGADMGYERFLQIARGYADEIRLWVVGERPWDHCVAGLAGRTLRRLPDKGREQGAALASSGVRR
jgi:hypothetical protein